MEVLDERPAGDKTGENELRIDIMCALVWGREWASCMGIGFEGVLLVWVFS